MSAATCAVSGLPIEPGERVRWLLLTRSPFSYGDRCAEYHHGPNDAWFPRVVPVRARLGEYGALAEVDEGPVLAAWHAGLRRDLVHRPHGRGMFADATPRGMDTDRLERALLNGRVRVCFLADGEGQVSRRLPVASCWIRDDVYAALRGLPIERPEIPYAELPGVAAREVASLVELHANPPAAWSLDLEMRHARRPFLDALGSPVVIGECPKSVLRDVVEAGAATPAVVQDVADFVWVTWALRDLRHAWRPGGGGPKYGRWATHAAFLRACTEIAAREAVAQDREAT